MSRRSQATRACCERRFGRLSLRLKVMLKLEPTAEMTLAQSVMLGTPPEGVDAGKLDAILFENLPSVETEDARKLVQEYALKMGVLDCINPLAQLGGKGALTDERLIAPLLD